MASSFTVRLQRFPYLVIGWALLAGLSLVAPDRLFLTQRQGLWLGLAFLRRLDAWGAAIGPRAA